MDSEDVSKRLTKEEVVCLKPELGGGRRGSIRQNVVESRSLKRYFSLSVSRDSSAGIVEGFGDGREV